MALSASTIFLSYSAEDAHSARRLCRALRAAELDVWFDQSELRGGDAWDASIRKQIRGCGPSPRLIQDDPRFDELINHPPRL
jgi:hypothetical protein